MTRLAGQTRAVEHEMEALAGIVKLGLTAVFDAQHGGVATGWSPVSWGLIDELFVNLTMPNQFIRKPDAEYLRIDFESDWPAAAKRAAAGTLSSLDTTVRQEAFGFQVLAGADYALTEHTSVGVTGRWAQFGHITDEATWDLIRSHAPVQADGVTPFDTTQRFDGISYLAVTVGLKYYF